MPHATRSFELRVLDGEQRGATVGIAAGVVTTVGMSWHDDVVLQPGGALRVDGQAPARAELRLEGDEFELHVLHGPVLVARAEVAAGTRCRVPLYTVVLIGGAPIALGELGASPWGALFAAPLGIDPPMPAAQIGASSEGPPRWGWPRRLVLAGGALAAASLSMLALAFAVAPAAPTAAQRAHRAQALLHSAGFAAASVAARPDGELVVSGYLETDAQRVRAQQLLEGDGLRARLQLWVNEQVATAVQDVYRINGISADVQAAGPGVVSVKTQVEDSAALQRAESVARRDVPGLTKIESRNQPPARLPSAPTTPDDPGKRIASIVGGETPYVVTADGTRYFVGALLPTGHRIQFIDSQSLRLEREGQFTTLAF